MLLSFSSRHYLEKIVDLTINHVDENEGQYVLEENCHNRIAAYMEKINKYKSTICHGVRVKESTVATSRHSRVYVVSIIFHVLRAANTSSYRNEMEVVKKHVT